MLWPIGETTLVQADHLDIVGHYELESVEPKPAGPGCEPSRTYWSYDALKSSPRFAGSTFDSVWTEVFDFAAMSASGRKRRAATAG
jgi:hypothetical protein